MFRNVLCAALWAGSIAFAQNASLHGIVHDAQHRPIDHVQIELKGGPSNITQNATSNAGEFAFDNVPTGRYELRATAAGFAPLTEAVDLTPGKAPVVHLQLEVAALNQSIEISGDATKLETQTSTVKNVVTPADIQQTPGAGLTNSLSMITDFTPGATMVHDMLHLRGGHQVNWFFDGIPVVNTSIAANVAPLINPKNVEELEIERGGYSSQYGDRTYGFFNVVTPSGFERNNEGELILSGGNFYSSDDQFDVGGHTSRFAYYTSVDGNRSNLGLDTPTSQVTHDAESGEGGFISLLFNPDAKNQLRWVGSLRNDHYQIPASDDLDLERDFLGGFNWGHSFSEGVVFSLTPYFHFNSAQYLSGRFDTPYVLNDDDRSNYLGVRAVLQAQKKQHDARLGIESWAQRDNDFFSLTQAAGTSILSQTQKQWADNTSVFVEDQYKVLPWLSLDLGLRLQHYSGLVNGDAFDPRIGGSIRLPKLQWTLHGYYAYYYQPPPLDSLAGSSLQFAIEQGFNYVPLRGERDIQHDVGLDIPVRGWSVDVDNFHTSAKNFLDHDVIGNSGIFVPLSDLGAIISGTEVSLRSPRLWHAATLRIAYSNQIAQGIGPITGGLLEYAPSGNFLLDHDQRNTASAVLPINLPHRVWLTPAYQFGSGFLNGDGPSHLPPHSTFDLSLGKKFGERFSASVNAVNIGNSRYLLDTSNTFGGTHYVHPRQIYVELRYRFHL